MYQIQKKNAKIKIYLIRMKGACGKTTLLAEFDNQSKMKL